MRQGHGVGTVYDHSADGDDKAVDLLVAHQDNEVSISISKNTKLYTIVYYKSIKKAKKTNIFTKIPLHFLYIIYRSK